MHIIPHGRHIFQTYFIKIQVKIIIYHRCTEIVTPQPHIGKKIRKKILVILNYSKCIELDIYKNNLIIIIFN